MARKTTRAPRRPAAPPPSTRPQPRRPAGGAPGPAAAAPVVRSEEDYAHEYAYVKRDLARIAVIGTTLLALIILAPRFLP